MKVRGDDFLILPLDFFAKMVYNKPVQKRKAGLSPLQILAGRVLLYFCRLKTGLKRGTKGEEAGEFIIQIQESYN